MFQNITVLYVWSNKCSQVQEPFKNIQIIPNFWAVVYIVHIAKIWLSLNNNLIIT